MTNTSSSDGDIVSRSGEQSWFYSDVVKDHFFNPRNFMQDEAAYADAAMGLVGSPACGDAMKVWIKVDPATEKISDCRWKTFGCGSAIASTSMMSVMVTENGGMTLDEARKLRPQDILERLGGLPSRKIHCSVLGDKALRAAINDWYRRNNRLDKVEDERGRIIDPETNVTDKDIEHAVLDGADTLEKLQAKLKVGVGHPECLPEVEQLIRFYKEKYFGL
ncbi:iron-sulfur cluster assembly scaffold protein [Candidatus Uhrbacteria bacterium]|nr:iron-sulfur cluster assembly scaffold protein [Candidatus Uhrbacteria bacterium]